MGAIHRDDVLVAEIDFEPEADVFSVWVSQKTRPSTKNGQPIRVQYWEGCWDIPMVARAEGDSRKRPQITASSTVSADDAERKCRQKILDFWLARADGVRQETYHNQPASLTREQRRAAYTVKTFLEEYFASRTNPNTLPQNRWAENTALRNKTMLEKWIYPYLGDTLLTDLTHSQVRIHFTETLPSVLNRRGERALQDRRIRNIFSIFRTGLNRASSKGLLPRGEYTGVGIQTQFEGAGVPEDIEVLMWQMFDLLQREEVINDPLTLRWALAFGQALRRGERCGLKWSDINFQTGKMKIRRQMNYVKGRGDFLDNRLKANEPREIDITDLTWEVLNVAWVRRQDLMKDKSKWKPKEEFADLVLLRDDGSAEILNHDNELFHKFMSKYQITYGSLSPGSLRHASATWFANYGGPDGTGVNREDLRKFMGHSAKSKLDAYYVRASSRAMTRAFGRRTIDRPNQPKSLTPDN